MFEQNLLLLCILKLPVQRKKPGQKRTMNRPVHIKDNEHVNGILEDFSEKLAKTSWSVLIFISNIQMYRDLMCIIMFTYPWWSVYLVHLIASWQNPVYVGFFFYMFKDRGFLNKEIDKIFSVQIYKVCNFLKLLPWVFVWVEMQFSKFTGKLRKSLTLRFLLFYFMNQLVILCYLVDNHRNGKMYMLEAIFKHITRLFLLCSKHQSENVGIKIVLYCISWRCYTTELGTAQESKMQ